MIRVLIVASSSISQRGLENLLRASTSLQVVGVLSDLGQLSENLEELQPDVLIAEVTGQDRTLPEEILKLSEEVPVAIVLLVDDANSERDLDALRNGVRAVLPRNMSSVGIVAAVEAVGAGLAVLLPEGVDTLLRESTASHRAVSPPLVEALTPREIEVLGMMVEGWGNKEISTRLGISEHTVKFHVASIMGKLNASSRTEAVTSGIRHGLIML
ncbi:MAG TPA: response regulator transcription factor [Verrucomicrobiae bacterium]|jgi:NarL family two-component system response regulator YdfI|nr:response regulator transcription factor [Verrucomicrobiae bacterium]